MTKIFMLGTAFMMSSLNIISQGAASTVPFAEASLRRTEIFAVRAQEKVWLTAYSSTPEETDDTPYLTASGTIVRHGVVATNQLPFGTKIQIPELFGEKIFVVEDRMHRRKKGFVDIWMPTKEEAKRFGIVRAYILILEETGK